MTQPGIPLGHTIPAHRAFGWCSHCPDHTVAEELAAWQTREPIDVSPGPAAEIDRLRTANERMRHELEVMYGGAFDKLPEPAAVSAAVAPPTDPTHGLSVQHADALWDAVAIPGPRTPTYPEQHERVCRAVRDILNELTPARADADAQTALRDRIAEAMRTAPSDDVRPDWTAPGGPLKITARINDLADAVLAELPSAADWDDLVREADRLRRDGAALHARAEELDTQLAALRQQVTEPTDRAAVLSAAADAVARLDRRKLGIAADTIRDAWEEARDEAEAALRRMADETATQTPKEQ